jgi:hypothetical protein
MGRFVSKEMASEGVKDGKNKYRKTILDCIDESLSIFRKALPVLGVVATILAMISLSYYAHEENIDVFNHYSSWVSVVPVIAIVVILIGLLFVVLALYPAGVIYFLIIPLLRQDGIEGNNRSKLQGNPLSDEEKLKRKSLTTKVILVYALSVVLPFILVALGSGSEWVANNFWFCFVIYILITATVLLCLERYEVFDLRFFYKWQSFRLLLKENEWLRLLSKISKEIGLFIALSISICLAVISVFLADHYFRSGVSNRWWDYFVLIDLLFLGFMLLIIYLFRWDSRSRLCLRYILVIGLLLPFITPFSTIISSVTLKNLGMGGGMERVYYVNEDGKSKVPSPFIDDTCCDDYEFCLTEELSIKWAVGDLVYVSLPEEENKQGETEADKEKTNKQAVPKQTIALPRNILFSYSVDEGDSMGCKTQKDLIEAANEGKK